MDKAFESKRIKDLKNVGFLPFELPINKFVPDGFIEEDGVAKRIISVRDETDWTAIKQKEISKETVIIEEKI